MSVAADETSVASVDDAPEAPTSPTARPKKRLRACERCGTFARRTNVFGARVCADCAQRIVHPAARGPLETRSVLGAAARIAIDVGLIALPLPFLLHLGSAAIQVLLYVGSAATHGSQRDLNRLLALALVPTAFQLVAGSFVTGLTLRLGWSALRREPIAFGDAARASVVGYVPLLVTTVRQFLSVWGHALLLFVPGVLRFLDLQLAPALTVIEGLAAGTALDESAARSRPIRWVILGAALTVYGPMLLTSIVIQAVDPLALISPAGRLVVGLGSAVGHLAATYVAVVLFARTRLIRGV